MVGHCGTATLALYVNAQIPNAYCVSFGTGASRTADACDTVLLAL
jgi:hypothetical protein